MGLPARDAAGLMRRAAAQGKLREELMTVVEHLDQEIEVRSQDFASTS